MKVAESQLIGSLLAGHEDGSMEGADAEGSTSAGSVSAAGTTNAPGSISTTTGTGTAASNSVAGSVIGGGGGGGGTASNLHSVVAAAAGVLSAGPIARATSAPPQLALRDDVSVACESAAVCIVLSSSLYLPVCLAR